MNNDVKQIIYSYGADVCGIADIERFAAAPPGFSPSDLFRAVSYTHLTLPTICSV